MWNNGQHLLSGSGNSTLKVWERNSDGHYCCTQTLNMHSTSPVRSVSSSSDGRLFLVVWALVQAVMIYDKTFHITQLRLWLNKRGRDEHKRT